MERKHDIFTIVPSHHRIRGTPCTCWQGRISPLPPGTLTRHKEQYVQTSRSCKIMYKATCSSQAPLALQLQVAVEFWSYHSGRTLIRLGRANSGSLSISASRLPPSPCRTPGIGSAGSAAVSGGGGPSWTPGSWTRSTTPAQSGLSTDATIETRTVVLINAHGENNENLPEISSRVLSVRFSFWDRLSNVRAFKVLDVLHTGICNQPTADLQGLKILENWNSGAMFKMQWDSLFTNGKKSTDINKAMLLHQGSMHQEKLLHFFRANMVVFLDRIVFWVRILTSEAVHARISYASSK